MNATSPIFGDPWDQPEPTAALAWDHALDHARAQLGLLDQVNRARLEVVEHSAQFLASVPGAQSVTVSTLKGEAARPEVTGWAQLTEGVLHLDDLNPAIPPATVRSFQALLRRIHQSVSTLTPIQAKAVLEEAFQTPLTLDNLGLRLGLPASLVLAKPDGPNSSNPSLSI